MFDHHHAYDCDGLNFHYRQKLSSERAVKDPVRGGNVDPADTPYDALHDKVSDNFSQRNAAVSSKPTRVHANTDSARR